jgi:hypothetical protein
MQSMETGRFAAQRIGIAVLAVGALTMGLVGLTELRDGSDVGGGGSLAVTQDAPRAVQADEQKSGLDGAETTSQAPAQSWDDIRFREMNALPGDVIPRVVSYAEMRFLEINTQLPSGGEEPFHPSPPERGRPDPIK